MQLSTQTKTDYKTSMFPRPRTNNRLHQWKWPFAIGLLVFAVCWRIGDWQSGPPLDLHEEIAQHPAQEEKTLPPPELSDDVSLLKITSDDLLVELAPQLLEPIAQSEVIANVMNHKKETFTVQAGDSLALFFKRISLPAVELHELLTTINHATWLKKLLPGQVIDVELDLDNKLQMLNLKIDALKDLVIKRDENNKFFSEIIHKEVERKTAFGSSKINDSLYLAGKHAHLSDKLIMELAQIFEYDIDFALDIRIGDSFKVLFEEQFAEGKKVGSGPILAAEFITQGKKFQAFRYVDDHGKASYVKADGQSIRKAFVRSPVEYTRISSHFNLKRKHPVLHKIRAHKGVDYAAPTGTPVKASGNGKIIFVGRKGGYGNTVIIQHGTKYSTLYAHLSRFNKNAAPGKFVKQGDVIGYVGSTGLASGPHLHYEFRVNGVHQNPLTVALPNGQGVPPHQLKAYEKQKNNYLALMENHEQLQVAGHESSQYTTQ